MKKHIIQFRKLFVGFALTGLLFMAAAPAIAAKSKSNKAEISMEPRITYIGSKDNSTLVSVAFETVEPVKFEIMLSDESGILYKQTFETATFFKYFKLVNEGDKNLNSLEFTIRNLNTGESHNYSVNSATEFVNKVLVSKL